MRVLKYQILDKMAMTEKIKTLITRALLYLEEKKKDKCIHKNEELVLDMELLAKLYSLMNLKNAITVIQWNYKDRTL